MSSERSGVPRPDPSGQPTGERGEQPAAARPARVGQPGLVGFRISATESAGLEWGRLADTWSLAAGLPALSAGWMSDHLSDVGRERNGPAFEALTTAAALAGRVPGKWVGVAVFSATFRHPAIMAKGATLLDTITGGRFILGLGAGWHPGEHEAFGIPLPPLRERFDRYESTLRVLAALFSDQARTPPGVSLDDPFHPLLDATNEPGPLTPGGPPIWLGGQRSRGIALAVRYAQGWPMPGNRPGDVAYFADRRDAIRGALEAAGRDPQAFTFAAQLSCGTTARDRAAARRTALAFVRAGAGHVILGVPAAVAPDGLASVAAEVAAPLLEAVS